MKLPVLAQPNYLSPSSLEEMMSCNMRFYLKRMTGLPWPNSVQGTAAAIGSAFDSFVKAEIAEHLGLGGDPQHQIEALLKSSVDEVNHDAAVPMGRILFMEYKRSGMLKRLLDEGLTSVEMSQKLDLVCGDDMVPVLGKPDAALSDGTIVDWKVQGSASKSGASPTQGYVYGKRGFQTLPPHKKAGAPLEELNDKWARQLAIYSWLYSGMTPFRDVPVAIENVTVRSGKYAFTSIRTIVTAEFQEKLWSDLVYNWYKVQEGEMDNAVPTQRKCYAYNQRCEVSDRCDAFKQWEAGQSEGTDVIDRLMGR